MNLTHTSGWRRQFARRLKRGTLAVLMSLPSAACTTRDGGAEAQTSACLGIPGRLALVRVGGVGDASGRLASSLASVPYSDTISASDLDAVPTVVVYWSVWCDTCEEALEDLDNWTNGSRGSELNVIAINSDGASERAAALEHIEDSRHSFGAYLVDDGAHDMLNPRGYTPTVCVSDADGDEVLRFVGYSPENKRALFESLESFDQP